MSTIRTVFIGPVQIVEDYLNYTKFSYFSLLEVAGNGGFQEHGIRKTAPGAGFAQIS